MKLDTLSTWHKVVNNRDIETLDSLLAENVAFYSPVVHTPQIGKAITKQYLTAALFVLFNESFHYVREIKGDEDAMLEFEVEIDGITVNGVDIIKWNDEGQIIEFKVIIRPLKAINLIHQKMAAMLAK